MRLKAVIREGFIVTKAPRGLAEGSIIEIDVDEYSRLDKVDELSKAEKAKLHAALDRGWAQARAGLGMSGKDFLKKLRAQ